jgi:hypothetical protein
MCKDIWADNCAILAYNVALLTPNMRFPCVAFALVSGLTYQHASVMMTSMRSCKIGLVGLALGL